MSVHWLSALHDSPRSLSAIHNQFIFPAMKRPRHWMMNETSHEHQYRTKLISFLTVVDYPNCSALAWIPIYRNCKINITSDIWEHRHIIPMDGASTLSLSMLIKWVLTFTISITRASIGVIVTSHTLTSAKRTFCLDCGALGSLWAGLPLMPFWNYHELVSYCKRCIGTFWDTLYIRHRPILYYKQNVICDYYRLFMCT